MTSPHTPRRRRTPHLTRLSGAAAVTVVALTATLMASTGPAGASTLLNGNGSSFAAPAVQQWDADVSHSPYSLSVNYTSSNSGQGRYEFTNETVDFAVSDTGYVNASVGTTPPSFPYEFIPITAAGVAFMYNIPGLTQTLQLTSYTACLLLTGQITNWDDPALKLNGANAGITLPNLAVKPVTESDPAGTNYVLEEYCIAEQPAVWAQYAKNEAGTPPPSGVAISATTPGSNWEAPGNGYDEGSTAAVASNVANTSGSIGPVQENYAIDSGFTGKNPSQAVAAVQNASGKFTLPSPVDVASALAYATQLPNGTHQLNFNGLGPNVYNPSTYSYLLTPTKGWVASKGAVMSAFVNYVLTLGQEKAPSMNFASLGLSLERYGIDQVINNVPGSVSPTAAEDQGYACGDLTPTEVQAGQTTPTCGVTNGVAPPAPPGAAATALTNGTTGTTAKSGTTAKTGTTKAGTAKTGTAAVGASVGTTGTGSATGADPSVAITGVNPSMATTGSNPVPAVVLGVALFVVGWAVRRRLLLDRRTRSIE
jgi:ABC-type phosphate transport system substrate-binding protein